MERLKVALKTCNKPHAFTPRAEQIFQPVSIVSTLSRSLRRRPELRVLCADFSLLQYRWAARYCAVRHVSAHNTLGNKLFYLFFTLFAIICLMMNKVVHMNALLSAVI